MVERALRDCGWWPTTVLSGTAQGVDRLGEQWAASYGIPVERYPADWNGPDRKRAGHVRNGVMASMSEALVAIWDGSSPGTRDMIEAARARGRRVHVHLVPACSSICAPDEPCSVAATCLALPGGTPAGHQLAAGLGGSTVYADLDFETYSEAGFVWNAEANKWRGPPRSSQGKKGLPVVGAAKYAADPTAEVLCLAYDLKDGQGARFWRPGLPPPLDLWAHVMTGLPLEAHNASFERWVWERVCAGRMGWPGVRASQWRCSMAKSRAHTLPGKLGEIGKVLGLPVQKDKNGARLIDKFAMPRNPTATDPRRRVRCIWTLTDLASELADFASTLSPDLAPAKAGRMIDAHEKVLMSDHVDTLALGQYNLTDIDAEAHVSRVVPDMLPHELQYWQDDQAINHRGVAIDEDALHACIAVIEQAHEKYNAELHTLTGGAVARASELARLSEWLRTQGVPVGHGQGSMDDEAIEGLLKRPQLAPVTYPNGCVARPPAGRALEIRAAVGSASVKKVFSMSNMLSAAGRLHDLYVWHGARTGRPTGSGPQPTNLPKAGPPTLKCGACGHYHRVDATTCPWCGLPCLPGRKALEWTPAAAEDALSVIRSRLLSVAEHFFGDAMAAVSGVLRGLFVAAPGHDLISSDYTAIEGVVVACLAGEQWRIDAYDAGAPMYLVSAERMFGTTVADMLAYAKETGQHHPLRHKGKGGELGLGFGGWINALKQFGVDGTDDDLKETVLKWRAASPAIVELWGGQSRNWRPHLFGLEGMAVSAVQNPGTEYAVMRLDGTPTGISYLMQGDVLYCRLLSGRPIPYHRPRLAQSVDSWRGLELSFETWNTNPKNGPPGWVRMNTYSGRLCENVVQATARDIQMQAIRNCEAGGYPIVLHTYDEVVAEVPHGQGSVEGLEALMLRTPAWCEGWPIKAAGGWIAGRYRKG